MVAASVQGNRIAKRLKEARETSGLSQVELAAILCVDYKINTDRVIISKIERGLRPVRDKELYALCKALSISADWLLGLKNS